MRIGVSEIWTVWHPFDVSTAVRIASARLHRAGSAAYGPGGQAVASFLRRLTGDDYAIVEIERNEGRFSLILDPDWVELARSSHAISPDIVDDMGLPRSSVRAVVEGWVSDWSEATSDLSVEHSADQIPHLRLTGLRPSPTGADRNARPH